MKLWDIVKSLGSAALQVALPGTGSLIIGAVNGLLSDDKKLPITATGHDVSAAIASLPPDQQASVMEKEFDVDIIQITESNATLRTMLETEAKSPHTTRPYIAKGSFHVVAFAIIVAVSLWAYAVLRENEGLVSTVMNGWPFILGVTAPLVTLLSAYFGILKKEQKNKLDAAQGNSTPAGIAGILSSLINRK